MENNRSSQKRKLKNDIVLAVVIVVIAMAGLLLFNFLKTPGDFVSVKIDGVEKYRYSLSENVDTVIYTGEDNKQENRIVIKDGKASVVSATCPDKICVGHREISMVNESIVCLPHKVVVEIVSADSGAKEPDLVV